MCQLIVKPQDVEIEESTLRRCWQSNPDGAGLAVLINGEVRILKGFFKLKALLGAYNKFKEESLLIHFRYATHGEKIADNTHPFIIGDGAIGHNGILTKFLPTQQEKRSDTRVFIEDFLIESLKESGKSAHDFLLEKGTSALIGRLIGSSKLAALTPEGFIIFNESAGEWKEGAWYSAGFPDTYFSYGRCYRGIANQGGYIDDDLAYSNALMRWEREEDIIGKEVAPPKTEVCTICELPSKPLYTVGYDTVCNDCWDDLYCPVKPTEGKKKGEKNNG